MTMMRRMRSDDIKVGTVFEINSPLQDYGKGPFNEKGPFRIIATDVMPFRASKQWAEQACCLVYLYCSSYADDKTVDLLLKKYRSEPSGSGFYANKRMAFRGYYYMLSDGIEYIDHWTDGKQTQWEPLLLWTMRNDNAKADEWRNKYHIICEAVDRSSFTVAEQYLVQDFPQQTSLFG